MTKIPRNLKSYQNTPNTKTPSVIFQVYEVFCSIFRFRWVFRSFFRFHGDFGHIQVSGIFWSFFRFQGYYGHFLFYGQRVFWSFFKFMGVFWSFFRHRGYFGLFLDHLRKKKSKPYYSSFKSVIIGSTHKGKGYLLRRKRVTHITALLKAL